MRAVVGGWFLFAILVFGMIRGLVDGDSRDTPFLAIFTLLVFAGTLRITMRRFGRAAFYDVDRRTRR
jgi:hypothetical protein